MAHPEEQAPLLRLLGLASRRMVEALQERLADAGFDDHRVAHHSVMPHVPREGIRLTELAERAGMTKQAMSELVVDLERLGYLARSPDPRDGRAKLIGFTARGRRAAAVVRTSFDEMEAELTVTLGVRAVRDLRRTLLRMLAPPP